MFRKTWFIVILMILVTSGLAACSPSDQRATSPLKKPVSTPTATPVPPLDTFIAQSGWHSVAEKHGVNPTNTVTITTVATFPAQSHVIIHAQCRGNGTVAVEFQASTSSQPFFTLPPSCKTVVPSVMDYARRTFPKDEKDNVIVSISGNVEWQAMVEVPDA